LKPSNGRNTTKQGSALCSHVLVHLISGGNRISRALAVVYQGTRDSSRWVFFLTADFGKYFYGVFGLLVQRNSQKRHKKV
jgi:hypothetical protein